MAHEPTPPQPEQQQDMPGVTGEMDPRPDHGEDSYVGHGRLAGKRTIITGADSGIGRAVALAFAREGADVLISYLNEDEDARETARLVEEAGQKAVLVPGDVSDPAHCRKIVEEAVSAFGGLDVLVSNAAHQASFGAFEDITEEEWRTTFATNVDAFFYLVKAALPHMKEGASIIATTSINADQPSPMLLPYATTKGTIRDFVAGLGQMLAERRIRVNAVAPGPVWTPLIPSTMPPEKVKSFGKNTPIGRAGQPKELAPPYVMLASDESSYIIGATIPVTGGRPFI
ncbi:SDR family oxidoreductase [Roseitranquillus sediminis]|uniref:SDR family oxidoreductase n=1 Tax=Roseitranquillus sediminis TaxID=2809051 RepID=UPI001D0C1EF8|nr:SDR family oxidoreductase [Roseitranquillus sediminis]MBM9594177.1 SDR family oxidoreductase [Roseitranquillus sediminis]